MGASRKRLPDEPPDADLLERLRRLVAATADAARSPLVLACSGGADSTALMLLAADAFGRGRLRVAHVHHGLQADADAWLAHVAGQAALLGLAFEARRLAGAAAASRRFDGLGPEGWARQERYLALTAIARAAGAGAVLTAHHLHDQIETAMLQSARGAGRSGRSAMAAARPLGTPAPWLLRPLLDVPRERLRAVVARAGWDAVDDPSNTDPARTRTAIRSRVTAALAADVQSASRWLAAIAADRAAEARDRAQAALDLHEVRFPAVTTVAPGQFTGEVAGQVVGQVPGVVAGEVAEQGAGQVVGKVAGQRAPRWLLSRERLARFDAPRRAALWRLWLEQAGRRPPTRARLAEIDRQMVAAASTQAVVGHAGLLIVRHRDRIGLLSRLPEPLPVATRGIGDPASAGSASAGVGVGGVGVGGVGVGGVGVGGVGVGGVGRRCPRTGLSSPVSMRVVGRLAPVPVLADRARRRSASLDRDRTRSRPRPAVAAAAGPKPSAAHAVAGGRDPRMAARRAAGGTRRAYGTLARRLSIRHRVIELAGSRPRRRAGSR